MSRRVITTPLSVARLSDPLSDPRLCVPVSRRVCPCREGSSLCREISAREMPSVDRNQAESVTTCDREHLGQLQRTEERDAEVSRDRRPGQYAVESDTSFCERLQFHHFARSELPIPRKT